MDKPITRAEVLVLYRSLARLVANSLIENAATQSAIILLDPKIVLAIGPAREAIRKLWKPVLDSLGEATPESAEDMLRNFEGLVQ